MSCPPAGEGYAVPPRGRQQRDMGRVLGYRRASVY